MKTMKLLLIASLICLAYWCGRLHEQEQSIKDYEAACLQADFIRHIIDEFDGETEMFNIGAEIENSYEEYFQELDNPNIFKTKGITSIKDLDKYYWCY